MTRRAASPPRRQPDRANPPRHDLDVHVSPTYGPAHDCSRECWCAPRVDTEREDGAGVVVHRAYD